MSFSKDQILEIERKLAELPVHEKTENLNKLESVQLIQSTIRNLKTRGYTNPMIADFLSKEGFDITPQLLTSYLSMLQKKRGKRIKKIAKPKAPATHAVLPPPTPVSDTKNDKKPSQNNSNNIEKNTVQKQTEPYKTANMTNTSNFTSLTDTEKL